MANPKEKRFEGLYTALKEYGQGVFDRARTIGKENSFRAIEEVYLFSCA